MLRKEWDDLAKKNPERLNVQYVLDKKSRSWNGASLNVLRDRCTLTKQARRASSLQT